MRQQKSFPERVFPQEPKSCYQDIEKADYRRKLFSPKEKTKVCRDIELLLGEIIDDESVTNIVCRNCVSKISNCVKQIVDVRQKYKETQENLRRKRQFTSVKRMCRQEIMDGASFKRLAKELFPVFPAPTATRRDSSTQTQTCPEPSGVSAVNVCIHLHWLHLW